MAPPTNKTNKPMSIIAVYIKNSVPQIWYEFFGLASVVAVYCFTSKYDFLDKTIAINTNYVKMYLRGLDKCR